MPSRDATTATPRHCPGSAKPWCGRRAGCEADLMSTASGTGGVAVAGTLRPRRNVRRRLLDLLALLVVGAVFGLVLPRLASYDEIGRVLAGLSGPVLVGLAALALWNLVTYWLVLVAVLPALRLREAAVATLGSTAVANTLPAGA